MSNQGWISFHKKIGYFVNSSVRTENHESGSAHSDFKFQRVNLKFSGSDESPILSTHLSIAPRLDLPIFAYAVSFRTMRPRTVCRNLQPILAGQDSEAITLYTAVQKKRLFNDITTIRWLIALSLPLVIKMKPDADLRPEFLLHMDYTTISQIIFSGRHQIVASESNISLEPIVSLISSWRSHLMAWFRVHRAIAGKLLLLGRDSVGTSLFPSDWLIPMDLREGNP